MGRRSKTLAAIPDVPFITLSLDEQSRCLATNLQRARQRAGLTREDLSKMVVPHLGQPLSVSFLGALERQERTPSVQTLLAIAKALEIPPSALFARPRERPKAPQAAA